jgi:hypothetical protein
MEPGKMASDREILLRVDERTTALHNELIGPDRRSGRIPKIEETQKKHAEQINFWRGAIAILAALLTILGAAFMNHVWAGK